MFQRLFSPEFTKPRARAALIISIIGLVNLLSASCGTPPATPTDQVPPFGEDYVGRVIDETTQIAIEGAKVSLDVPGAGVPRVDYTDTQGIFQFSLFITSEKIVTIRVEAQGYDIYTRDITLTPGQLRIEDIRLAPQQPTFTPATLTNVTLEGSLTPTIPSPVATKIGPTIPIQPAPQNTPVIHPSNTFNPPVSPVPPTNAPITGCIEILDDSWHIAGSGPLEKYDGDMGSQLQGKTYIQVTFDLHGFTILSDTASAIFFDQPPFGEAHYVSLADYAENGKDGTQTVNIPLSAFPDLNLNDAVGTLHTRFWSEDGQEYMVDIFSIMACS